MSGKQVSPPAGRNEWIAEFREFMDGAEVAPPAHLSRDLKARVSSQLNPSAGRVFSKALAIHAVVGFLTLLLCPQFGMGFSEHAPILHWLMQYGHAVCSFGCGAFFVGSGALVTSFVLTREEIRSIRRTEFLQLMLISAIAAAVFLALGGDVIDSLGLMWIAGSTLGGLTALELGWSTRRLLAQS